MRWFFHLVTIEKKFRISDNASGRNNCSGRLSVDFHRLWSGITFHRTNAVENGLAQKPNGNKHFRLNCSISRVKLVVSYHNESDNMPIPKSSYQCAGNESIFKWKSMRVKTDPQRNLNRQQMQTQYRSYLYKSILGKVTTASSCLLLGLKHVLISMSVDWYA